MELKKELEEEKNGENDNVDAMLSKIVVIQALHRICEDDIDWSIVAIVDDLVGFGKTVISLPKNVLNKQELEKYIEEIKKKKVGDQR
jgi:hypothetical protein